MEYVRPAYEVVIRSPNGKEFTVKKLDGKTGNTEGLVTSLSLTESRNQLARRATIRMYNRYIDKHGYPSCFLSEAKFLSMQKAAARQKGRRCSADMCGTPIIAWEMACS